MIKNHPAYQKALKTNKVTRTEAEQFFASLWSETFDYIKKRFPDYYLKGMWPIKARVVSGGNKQPEFILNHCTSNQERKHTPAIHRFITSDKASAHFLVCDDGMIVMFASLDDMTYHAINHVVFSVDIARLFGVAKEKFINVPGIETVGCKEKLFSYEQFEANIALQRLIVAYFETSIKELKSHKAFAPLTRPHDPSHLFFLPLVEHAVFNDVDITKDNYWVQQYKKDEILFANQVSINWIQNLKLVQRDEWWDFRNSKKGKVDNSWLL